MRGTMRAALALCLTAVVTPPVLAQTRSEITVTSYARPSLAEVSYGATLPDYLGVDAEVITKDRVLDTLLPELPVPDADPLITFRAIERQGLLLEYGIDKRTALGFELQEYASFFETAMDFSRAVYDSYEAGIASFNDLVAKDEVQEAYATEVHRLATEVLPDLVYRLNGRGEEKGKISLAMQELIAEREREVIDRVFGASDD